MSQEMSINVVSIYGKWTLNDLSTTSTVADLQRLLWQLTQIIDPQIYIGTPPQRIDLSADYDDFTLISRGITDGVTIVVKAHSPPPKLKNKRSQKVSPLKDLNKLEKANVQGSPVQAARSSNYASTYKSVPSRSFGLKVSSVKKSSNENVLNNSKNTVENGASARDLSKSEIVECGSQTVASRNGVRRIEGIKSGTNEAGACRSGEARDLSKSEIVECGSRTVANRNGVRRIEGIKSGTNEAGACRNGGAARRVSFGSACIGVAASESGSRRSCANKSGTIGDVSRTNCRNQASHGTFDMNRTQLAADETPTASVSSNAMELYSSMTPNTSDAILPPLPPNVTPNTSDAILPPLPPNVTLTTSGHVYPVNPSLGLPSATNNNSTNLYEQNTEQNFQTESATGVGAPLKSSSAHHTMLTNATTQDETTSHTSPSSDYSSEVAHSSGRSKRTKSPNGFFKKFVLYRYAVPSDNDCLFSSLRYALKGRMDIDNSLEMRELIVRAISANPELYTREFLGVSNSEYCAWIMQPDSWGGAIELSIFSNHFGVEIDVIMTDSLHIQRFGEDQNYDTRVILYYNGAHYDPLIMFTQDSAAPVTKFPTSDEAVFQQAQEVARNGIEEYSCTFQFGQAQIPESQSPNEDEEPKNQLEGPRNMYS